MKDGYLLVRILSRLDKTVWIELGNMLELQEGKNQPISNFEYTMGYYDAIIEIRADSEEDFIDTVFNITKMRGIEETMTLCIVPKEYISNKIYSEK